LTINFTNETQIILKRIIGGILISLLLILAVVSSLFYLLHIIKHQKQLVEVKNDLISNITHEFKTPIATISVAIESIKDFKIIDDKDKTKKYLELSSGQLKKLNEMVEKLLETATLDSDSLILHKESINIVDVLRSLVEKHHFQNEHKSIVFSSPSDSIVANVDVFHFENAINNVLDNALKYGGNGITLTVEQNSFSFTVSISDTGNSITKANKDKIFEKFYRIPKGNTHDVKGFGIGLYYTKKIVEKHGGTIHLNLEKNLTTFNLSFPNE
jgi:two-component system phosphate regulon sensor histidine kinase PhoR